MPTEVMLALSAKAPPVVSSVVVPPTPTGAVTVKPSGPTSFRLKLPVAAKPARFVNTLSLVSVTFAPALPVRFVAVMTVTPFCVTSPDKLSVPAPPRTTVPLAAEVLPKATVEAS